MTGPGSYTTETRDMYAVHRALSACFEAAGPLVGAAGDDPAKVATVASFYENVVELLRVHHEGEDELVFARLAERCPDDHKLLGALEAQHEALKEPMAAARQALAAWREDPRAGQQVASTLAVITATVAPHLTDEEQGLLPLASAYLSPGEWGELPGHAMADFRCDKPYLALGLVREQLGPEQLALMDAGFPEPLRQLWETQWGPAFVAFMGDVRAIASV